MAVSVVDVQCPGCGSPWATTDTFCGYCGRQVLINSMSDMLAMDPRTARSLQQTYENALDNGADTPDLYTALGMAFLRLGLPDRALRQFENAADRQADNSEVYFYTAVAMLSGRTPFRAQMNTIREAERYLGAALKLENRGIYTYLQGYICKDFYERKFLNTRLSSAHYLQRATKDGATQLDVENLFELLDIDLTKAPKLQAAAR